MTLEEQDALKGVVKSAVVEVMADIGLHADERKEIRKDMAHLRKWRVAVDRAETSVRNSLAVTLVTGFVGLVVLGFKETIFSWFK